MAFWAFETPTVAEAPFAWNPLMERFRMNRGVSIIETTPGVFEQIRYYSYTDETGAANLPRDTAYQSQEFYKPIRVFRGGYVHIVDDATRTALIASGLVTASNFSTPVGSFGYGGFGDGPFGG